MPKIPRSAIIILYFLTSKSIAESDFIIDKDVFFGKESFIEDTRSFVYARCNKVNEPFEKVCFVLKVANIFVPANLLGLVRCPAILESKRRNTVVGSNIKILPFGNNKAILMWVEKYEKDSVPEEVFIEFSIINFENCSKTDFEISLPLKSDEKSDDALEKVSVVTDDTENKFFLIFYNKKMCKDKICRMIFNDQGQQVEGLKPWFAPDNGVIREFVPLKYGDTELGFLAITDFPETYLIDRNEKVTKLPLYSDADSKVILSTDHDIISICYYADSKYSCGQFTYNGELKMKRRLKLKWEITKSFIHYLPEIGLFLITTGNSKSCNETEVKRYITVIMDNGIVESHELNCLRNDFTDFSQFYHIDVASHCMISAKLTPNLIGDRIETMLSCYPSMTPNVADDLLGQFKTTTIQINPNM